MKELTQKIAQLYSQLATINRKKDRSPWKTCEDIEAQGQLSIRGNILRQQISVLERAKQILKGK